MRQVTMRPGRANGPSTTVCILAKAPAPGTVKTRLAATLGDVLATDLARAFFWDTLALADRLERARVVVALAGDPALLAEGAPRRGGGLASRAELWPQGEGDLGERLERSLRRALRETDRVLSIGTDSPGLPIDRLQAADEALANYDAVLGPADDGGFYLLGLRACPRGLLMGLPWSSSDTCEKTLARLAERGFSVKVLPAWFDVDEAPDLARLAGLLSAGAVVAEATFSVLRGNSGASLLSGTAESAGRPADSPGIEL